MKLGDKQDKKVSPLTSESVLGASRIGKSSAVDATPQSMVEVLGSIYDLLSKIQSYEKLQSELELVDYELAYMDEQDRNKKIIEALGGKKPKKKKEKGAEKVIKKEKAKPKTKPAPEKTQTTKTKSPKPSATKAPPKEAPSAPTPKVEPTPTPTPKPTMATPSAARVATGAAVGAAGVFASTQAFSQTMYPYAEDASKKLGGKIPPVAILGQWAGESGSGKSVAAPFNYAGIKAGKNFKKGDFVLTEEKYSDEAIKRAQASGESLEKVLGPNDKITKKGRQVTIDEWYGKGSLAQAAAEGKKWVQVRSYFAKFDNYEDFVNGYVSFLSSPRYAKARESTTPGQFGTEVAKAGYATNSAEKYSQHIASFAQDFKPTVSGDRINSSSNENKNLKADAIAANQDKPAITVNNNKTTTTGSSSSGSSGSSDDTNAYQRKLKG